MTDTSANLVNSILEDYEENYVVYWEDDKGNEHFDEDYYLSGKRAMNLYNEKLIDCHVRYVELRLDDLEEDADVGQIVLMRKEKKVLDILGIKVYI